MPDVSTLPFVSNPLLEQLNIVRHKLSFVAILASGAVVGQSHSLSNDNKGLSRYRKPLASISPSSQPRRVATAILFQWTPNLRNAEDLICLEHALLELIFKNKYKKDLITVMTSATSMIGHDLRGRGQGRCQSLSINISLQEARLVRGRCCPLSSTLKRHCFVAARGSFEERIRFF